MILGISHIAVAQNHDSVNVSDKIKKNFYSKIDTPFFKIIHHPDSLIQLSALAVTKKNKAAIGLIKTDTSFLKSEIRKSKKSYLKIPISKPLLKIGGGYISYNLNYRSGIDTPVVEKNITQHNLNGSMKLSFAGIPMRANYLLRRSNSVYFRNINDIQIEYDAGTYRNNLQNNFRQILLSQASQIKDILLEIDFKYCLSSFKKIDEWVNNPNQAQKFIESKELLNMPLPDNSIAPNDSQQIKRISALKVEAKRFIDLFESKKRQLDSVIQKKDSVEKLYNEMNEKSQRFKELVNNKLNLSNEKELQNALRKYLPGGIKIPPMYRFLLNVRKFGIGKNQVNYSELTSKNISLTGLNFEYNSWYYFAMAAGTVDYRFRDFVVNKFNKTPQFMSMIRMGIGRVENSHLIVSAFKGRKQLFASSTSVSSLQSIDIAGLSLEGKIKFHNYANITAEASESLSPDFRKTPVRTPKFSLGDQTNKAFSLKLYAMVPETNTIIEAAYKYIGANYQSFSSFQTNAEIKSWNIKVVQKFFKRKLSLTASMKTNDFSNPYVPLNYKSNTVFKGLSATFKAKHLPVVSVSYAPISQLTFVDSTLIENMFYSFNTSVIHIYKLGDMPATTSIIYNRFYNDQVDTSFTYYNARNIYLSQSVSFEYFNLSVTLSNSKSPDFELNVFDGYASFKVGKVHLIGFGFKVNDFNREISKIGPYGTFRLNLKNWGFINASYVNGYIPTTNHRFIQNNMMNIGFVKQF